MMNWHNGPRYYIPLPNDLLAAHEHLRLCSPHAPAWKSWKSVKNNSHQAILELLQIKTIYLSSPYGPVYKGMIIDVR